METIFAETVAIGKQCLISKGESLMYKRVYQDGIILLKNIGHTNTKVMVLWLNDIYAYKGETQFALNLASGSTIEFEIPHNQHSEQFLDTIVLDHISGGKLEVSCVIPREQLN